MQIVKSSKRVKQNWSQAMVRKHLIPQLCWIQAKMGRSACTADFLGVLGKPPWVPEKEKWDKHVITFHSPWPLSSTEEEFSSINSMHLSGTHLETQVKGSLAHIIYLAHFRSEQIYQRISLWDQSDDSGKSLLCHHCLCWILASRALYGGPKCVCANFLILLKYSCVVFHMLTVKIDYNINIKN